MTQSHTQPPALTSDGIEIIAVERAHGPHPNPARNGEIVPFSYVDELLLANGETRYRCTKPTVDGSVCNKDTFTEVRGAVGHMPSHNPDKSTPDYPETTLRLLVRLVKTEEAAGHHRGKLERVADELNRRGVPTLSGAPWIAGNVGSLFHAHKSKFRVRVRVPRAESTPPTPSLEEIPAVPSNQPTPAVLARRAATAATRPDAAPTTSAQLLELDARGRKLTTQTNDLVRAAAALANDLERFQTDVARTLVEVAQSSRPDPEVLEKARKYDAMRGLLS